VAGKFMIELKDSIFLVIGIVSVIAAVTSALSARRAVRNQNEIQSWIINYTLISKTNEILIRNHNLLNLLGIDAEELASDGITPEELIYVDANMSAGHILYRVGWQKRPELTGYRKRLLNNNKVRLIWKKYLSGRLFNDTAWTRLIDRYVSEQEDDTACRR
jgi:hypothetical protein